MTSRLASLLVQDGIVSAKKMAEAFQRQVIYGGTLDTILLEMDVVDEGTLLDALGRSSALPIAGDLPSLEQLQAAPGGSVQKWMPLAMSERFRALPVALEGSMLRVLVIDPPDRKQLDELGYTLSLTIDPIIVPEHRFVQAVELVYGVPVPARFASLAAKLRQRATDPNRARLTPTTPSLPMQPAREQRQPEPNAPVLVGDRVKDGTPTEPQRVAPVMMAQHAPPVVETARKVVTDVPMPNAKPATAPASELPEQLTPKLTARQAGAPTAAVAPEAAARTVVSPAPSIMPAAMPSSTSDPTPLSIDDARAAIDAANDRDGIFESLCRGARARL
ncbi:MAG TPA: hypothetical protein VHB97_02505, partial [Polyangia bacterium]|nr:hypothetical protein [Polyangia bacterium]